MLRTVSGIRGQVKKALTGGKGDFRATFEDKLLRSDIVVLRAWVPVDIPHLYNPVTTLLGQSAGALAAAAAAAHGGANGVAAAATAARAATDGWVAMRSHGEVRAERGLTAPQVRDSLYRKIEREPRRFNPLKIPTSLQAALPFKSKPKLTPKRRGKSFETKRAVVVEPAEKRVGTFMQQLQTLRNAKETKARARAGVKAAERAARMAKEEAARAKATKEHLKRRYRRQGIEEEIKAKIAKKGGGGRAHERD